MGLTAPGQLCTGSERLGDGVQAKTSNEYETLLQSPFEIKCNTFTHVKVNVM